MTMTPRRSLLFFYTETPLHAGCGAGMGAIDLPLQRERMSDLPLVQGSGVKGALRELFLANRGDDEALRWEEALFGPRPPDLRSAKDGGDTPVADGQVQTLPETHAGALAVTDARLLLMPVRTAHGGWAWITSPLILQRFARDLGLALPDWINMLDPLTRAPTVKEKVNAIVADQSAAIAPNGQLVIEDALYETITVGDANAMNELIARLVEALPSAEVYQPLRDRLRGQLAILSDEEMIHWARHGTEVVTRVRINPDKGTVDEGALWTEELLPSESVLWSLVMVSDSRRPAKGSKSAKAELLEQRFAQRLAKHPRTFLGGDRTVGRGLVALGRKELG